MRWPTTTILAITLAVLVGIVHAALERTLACLLETDDLYLDPFGSDGYGP